MTERPRVKVVKPDVPPIESDYSLTEKPWNPPSLGDLPRRDTKIIRGKGHLLSTLVKKIVGAGEKGEKDRTK